MLTNIQLYIGIFLFFFNKLVNILIFRILTECSNGNIIYFVKLEWLTQKHYQFTNFVIEDELQAAQIIVDVANHFLNKSESTLRNIHFKDNQIEVYKTILTFIGKRSNFSRYTFNSEELYQRAIFFIMIELEYDLSECAYITNYSQKEIQKIYSYEKFKFLEKKSISKELNNESWN